jgi:competence protein ComGC
MEFIKDLFRFLMHRKKWWLIPLIVFLLIIGLLLIFSSGSALAPFIYTLF